MTQKYLLLPFIEDNAGPRKVSGKSLYLIFPILF